MEYAQGRACWLSIKNNENDGGAVMDGMNTVNDTSWLDPMKIGAATAGAGDVGRARAVLEKARELKGLTIDDVATLANVTDPGLIEEMFAAARAVKETIYGHRIVFFAPLYLSNYCANECTYCAFRKSNDGLCVTR